MKNTYKIGIGVAVVIIIVFGVYFMKNTNLFLGSIPSSSTAAQSAVQYETRADFAKAIVLATVNQRDYSSPSKPTFSDVPRTSSYYVYIETAVKRKLMSGDTDSNGNPMGKFRPSDNVNRAEAIHIIVIARGTLSTLPSGIVLPFTDVPTATWYYGYVVAAYHAGLITDSGNHLFYPSNLATKNWVDGILAKK